jgi:hypothetical protein
MRYSTTTILFFTTIVLSSPVPKPLNINMGAYSPALVVGDGAIGFKGTESVTNLMNTLQGAAANNAAANGAAAPAGATAQPAAQPAAAEGAVAAQGDVSQDQAMTQLLEGMGKSVVTARTEEVDESEVDEEEDEYKRDVEELEGEVPSINFGHYYLC